MHFRSPVAALPSILLCATQVSAQTPPPRREPPPLVVVTPPAPSTKAGVLTCNTGPRVGFIVGGRQTLACQFMAIGPYPPESYLGDIKTIGLDVGATAGGTMVWAVFMPTRGAQYGSLAGKYGGVTVDVAVGVGAGGNLLVGGSDRSITLQPFSVEGSVGINLAVGVSDLVLLSVEPPSEKPVKQRN
jgi:Protein of unknown function (DUF992)